jgi:penicillin-binding protein A
MNRNILRLNWALAAGFVLLVVMLGWWQVVDAEDLRGRAGNQQTAHRERLIDRGSILTADGVAVARSAAKKVDGQTIYRRVYPEGTLAPHVVGFTDDNVGTTGLESTYDRYLSGSYGTEPLLQRLNLKAKRGATLKTTLIARVQRVANQQLLGRTGAVVALDPNTGAVLAMTSSPGYDLSKVATGFATIQKQKGVLVNRATSGRYAPGSTFKVVTATAALESDLSYTPTTQFDDNGSISTPGGPIRNFGGKVFGRHTLTDALTFSINTTFARIGTNLGAKRLGAEMTAFGFGARPGIDLPENDVIASGRYKGPTLVASDQEGEDTARIAIGQEQLVVTPLQMAMVASAIGNEGTLLRPYLVQTIVDRGGAVVREQTPQEVGQVASAQTAGEVLGMMRRVVDEGTGTNAALAGLSVAGKTGTAETGDSGLNNAWFIGLAPAESPKVAVAVVIENTTGTGGSDAAPVAREVMQAALAGGG